jgi:hypothetical protein
MKREGTVVEPGTDKVLVSVGDDTPPGQGAACCSVLSVRMEVGNPRGWEFRPGEAVEISDGLGRMILAGSNFVVLPALLFGVGSLWSFAAGIAGVVFGLGGALWIFLGLKLGRYPLISRRLSRPSFADFDGLTVPSGPWSESVPAQEE